MVAGHLQEKKGLFYIVLSYKDAETILSWKSSQRSSRRRFPGICCFQTSC